MSSWLHRQNVVRSFSSFSRFMSVVHRFLIPIPFIYTPTGCYFYFKKINALIFDSVLLLKKYKKLMKNGLDSCSEFVDSHVSKSLVPPARKCSSFSYNLFPIHLLGSLSLSLSIIIIISKIAFFQNSRN